ncbi:hypothetical protein AVEN_200700-1 [Araneus ventricosus]|uniref:Uncharacterized protein n=1 Tax=Araneus ventricosus TaxID=182803 RepID=A0A4Y2XDM8_ARAVE|nr:hypothetical protein AVEN_200700-1 [Araneus ventricosus]
MILYTPSLALANLHQEDSGVMLHQRLPRRRHREAFLHAVEFQDQRSQVFRKFLPSFKSHVEPYSMSRDNQMLRITPNRFVHYEIHYMPKSIRTLADFHIF